MDKYECVYSIIRCYMIIAVADTALFFMLVAFEKRNHNYVYTFIYRNGYPLLLAVLAADGLGASTVVAFTIFHVTAIFTIDSHLAFVNISIHI